jgi:hypothetical protein
LSDGEYTSGFEETSSDDDSHEDRIYKEKFETLLNANYHEGYFANAHDKYTAEVLDNSSDDETSYDIRKRFPQKTVHPKIIRQINHIYKQIMGIQIWQRGDLPSTKLTGHRNNKRNSNKHRHETGKARKLSQNRHFDKLLRLKWLLASPRCSGLERSYSRELDLAAGLLEMHDIR